MLHFTVHFNTHRSVGSVVEAIAWDHEALAGCQVELVIDGILEYFERDSTKVTHASKKRCSNLMIGNLRISLCVHCVMCAAWRSTAQLRHGAASCG